MIDQIVGFKLPSPVAFSNDGSVLGVSWITRRTGKVASIKMQKDGTYYVQLSGDILGIFAALETAVDFIEDIIINA